MALEASVKAGPLTELDPTCQAFMIYNALHFHHVQALIPQEESVGLWPPQNWSTNIALPYICHV